MIQEQIHDALNYIDDDMIEAVEALRAADAGRRKVSNIYKLKPSMFVAAAVACAMVIVAATTWAMSPFLRDMRTTEGAAPENETVYDGVVETCGSTLTGSGALEATTTDSENSTVLVRITSVTENGFAAVILESSRAPEINNDTEDMGGGASEAGTEYVYIVYSKYVELVENPELSVGSVVRVEYFKVVEGEITAERIMPEDFEED